MVWILDLDGVIWLTEQAVAGSADAVGRIRASGSRLLFLTNNAGSRVTDLVAQLGRVGVEAEPSDLVTSAQAAAGLIEPGSTALVCAGPGVVEALEERGVKTVREGDADAVVVGFHRDFDYERLTAAFLAVHHGARLIGTNDDTTYPTPHGLVPGGGSILAAVAAAAGMSPEVAGKPYAPMASAVAARLGGEPLEGILVGDRPSTDGLMAERLGLPFALVLTGVTSAEEAELLSPRPAVVAANLAAVVDQAAAAGTLNGFRDGSTSRRRTRGPR